jgi:hypothetical protein
MGFWNSFYGQMGRNTGKVFSNMIFGSSWSTPIRHISSKGSGGSGGGGGGGSSLFSGDPFKYQREHEKDMADKAIELEKMKYENEKEQHFIQRVEAYTLETKETKYGDSVEEICNQLDSLIINAEKLQSDGADSSFIVFKIRSGIMRLQSIGALAESEFYASQLRLYHRHKMFKTIGAVVMAIILLGSLLLVSQLKVRMPRFW